MTENIENIFADTTPNAPIMADAAPVASAGPSEALRRAAEARRVKFAAKRTADMATVLAALSDVAKTSREIAQATGIKAPRVITLLTSDDAQASVRVVDFTAEEKAARKAANPGKGRPPEHGYARVAPVAS